MALYFACFNVALWIFCYKYYKIHQPIKYSKQGQRVPLRIRKRDKAINTVFLVLNISIGILAGVVYFISGQVSGIFFNKVYSACKITVDLLQINSALFLFYGMFMIRKLTKLEGKDAKINNLQLVAVFAVFACFFISAIVLSYFYAIFVYEKPSDQNKMNFEKSTIATNWVSLAAELLLVYILWPITKL